jgi:hypothetical protein
MTEDLPPVQPPQPLSDPLVLATFLIGLIAIANIAFAGVMGHYANIYAYILIVLGYLLIVAPRRRPNAIYLRAFKTDKSTARLRRYLSAALGPKFRLAGIRPPSKRSNSFLRYIAPTLTAFKYLGSTYMELEAGDDWMLRLWATYRETRIAMIDIRDTTAHVHEEIQMTVRSLGLTRCLFLIERQRKSPEEWRDSLREILGPDRNVNLALMLDVSERNRKSGQMAADLKAIVARLPPPVGSTSMAGWEFAEEHGQPASDALTMSAKPKIWHWVIGVPLGLVVLGSLAVPLLQGALTLAPLVMIPLDVYLVVLFFGAVYRSAAAAWRLSRSGYRLAAIRSGLALLLGVGCIGLGGFLTAKGEFGRVNQEMARDDRNDQLQRDMWKRSLPQTMDATQNPDGPAVLRNDALHIYLTTSKELLDVTEAMNQQLQDGMSANGSGSCPSLLFAATNASGDEFRAISLTESKVTCTGDLAGSADDVATRLMAAQDVPDAPKRKLQHYVLGNHTASVVSGRMNMGPPSEAPYRTISCMAMGGENLCWRIVADTCSARAKLAATPVRVDGHAHEALVPARLLPKCEAVQ